MGHNTVINPRWGQLENSARIGVAWISASIGPNTIVANNMAVSVPGNRLYNNVSKSFSGGNLRLSETDAQSPAWVGNVLRDTSLVDLRPVPGSPAVTAGMSQAEIDALAGVGRFSLPLFDLEGNPRNMSA